MTYDFEEIIDRKGTDCLKHEYLMKVCGRTDVLPMWVADMEYRTPAFVTDAIQKRLGQGILGYTRPSAAYFQAICDWNMSEYGLDITPEMINYIPGVVSGIYMSMLAFTEKHDRILIMEPVYHPFRLVPQANDREVVMSPLRRGEVNFELDFERLEQDIKGCKMMVLCNPHNPGGVCWTADELRRIASICKREGVVVVSDEIHCDMLLGGRRHVPFASVSDEARSIAVTLQAPTKTFNLPGIVAAHAIVLDADLRSKMFGYIHGSDMDLGNILAFDCVKACYSDAGLQWKQEMLEYVDANIDLLCERMAAECPQIVPIRPQASYLVFLDCRGLGLGQEELIRFFADKAHICMNSGDMFGPSGAGYMRMNVACPRSMMQQAIDQIIEAVKNNPDVIGVVSTDWLRGKNEAAMSDFHGLDVNVMLVSRGKSAYDMSKICRPYQYYIATGDYPLVRRVYAITTDPRPSSKQTYFFYFLKSDSGQRIICNDSQLLPYLSVQVRDVNVHQ